TMRWRQTIASSKPPEMWGMIHVTDAEVEGFLNAPFRPPATIPQFPPDLEQAVNAFCTRAGDMAESIKGSVKSAPKNVGLRLARLQALFARSDFEKDVLLVCLLAELEARYRRLFGYLQDDASRTQPGVDLILHILQPVMPEAGTARAAFAPTG